MDNCNHNWNISKTERKAFWMPPNAEGLVLNSIKIVEHLKCNTCGSEKKDQYYHGDDIEALVENQ